MTPASRGRRLAASALAAWLLLSPTGLVFATAYGGTLWAANDLSLATTAAGHLGGTVAANRDLALHFTDYANGAGETRSEEHTSELQSH